MALTAYLDESIDGNAEKTLVLAGYISTAEKWVTLWDAWEALLKEEKNQEFKMKTMWDNTQKVEKFYSLIEANVLNSLGCIIDIPVLKAAVNDAVCDPKFGIFKRSLQNPYVLATKLLIFMMEFSPEVESIGFSGEVDFVFDNKVDAHAVLEGWGSFTRAVPTRRICGSLTFDDSKRMIPLQTADLLAGLIQQHETKSGPWNGKIPYKHEKQISGPFFRPPYEILRKEAEFLLSAENIMQQGISDDDIAELEIMYALRDARKLARKSRSS